MARHGDGRFSDATGNIDTTFRDRAGWWRDDGSGGRVYLFTQDGIREGLKGFHFKRALDILQESGALRPPDASGERAKVQRIARSPRRVYEIIPDHLEADHGA